MDRGGAGIVFKSGGIGSTGLVKNNGSTNTVIASNGGAINPSDDNDRLDFNFGGNLTELDTPSYNDAAIMAFWGNTGTKTGLVLRVDDTPTYNAIMVSGTAFMIDTAGGYVLSNGTVNPWSFSSTFSAPVLNNLKAVAFWATLTVSSEGLLLDEEAAADLVVTQILAPVRVRRNTHITVTAKIKNEGTSAGAPNTVQAQFIKSDLTTAMGNAGSTPSTSSLDNGKTRSVKVRVRVPAPAANDCPCYVKVDADAGSATPELSETNNRRNSSALQIR